MTLKATKQHLTQLLADPNNNVLALSGKWGTGKSYLWDELKRDSQDEKIKNSLYVSLFGLATMDQVKLKVIQSAIPLAKSNSALRDSATQALMWAKKIAELVDKKVAALNELALLAVPSILEGKMIVLDDIERKHRDLSVDEVMGFIDEFTQKHEARFMLILNSDQLELADHDLWEKLREKVIDQEVRLDTSPAEACQIALGIVPSPYGDWIKKTVEICRVTNIRVICKLIRAVNRILGDREDISDDVLSRVLPSTVLLAAIYYKGIDDGPDLDFVLRVGSNKEDKKEKTGSDSSNRKAQWRLMLRELGINSCDAYEHLVVEYLKSGLYDSKKLDQIIQQYLSEIEAMEVRGLVRKFYDHSIWHYSMPLEELLDEARLFTDKVHLLSCHEVTGLHDLLQKIEGGSPIAELLVDNWITEYKKRSSQDRPFEFFMTIQPIHPKIEKALRDTIEATRSKTSIFDACKHIVQHNGWDDIQEAVMKAATSEDFETTIRSLDVKDLQLFMLQLLKMCSSASTYKPYFGSATDHFIEACRNICVDPGSVRLGELIKLLFKDASLEAELAPEHSVSPTNPD